MLNAALSFLNRGMEKPKQICRVCRELAEIRREGLCADCAHVKARIHLRITQRPADGDTSQPTQECKRSGCVCPPCGRRIFDPHPFRPPDPAWTDCREIHFHPRCHELWLEAARGSDKCPGESQGVISID
jgi:hypothetical protein